MQQLFACVRQGQSQPLDLSDPVQVPVEHRHSSGRTFPGVLLLGNDSFEFREDSVEGKHSFKISPKQIKGLNLTSIGHGDKSDPRYMNQTLHFKEKTKAGRNMTIRVDLPTVIILVKYLARAGVPHAPTASERARFDGSSFFSSAFPSDPFAQMPSPPSPLLLH